MNPTSPKIRNLTLVLSTVAAIVLAFLGYYFFYVEQQEKNLDERNQRVLVQIRDNVIRKNRTYVQNAVNNAPQDIDQLKRRVIALVNEEIREESPRGKAGFAMQIVTNVTADTASTARSLGQRGMLLRRDPFSNQALTDSAKDSLPTTRPFSASATVIVDRDNKVFVVKEAGRRDRSLAFSTWQERSNRLTTQLRYEITPDTRDTTPVILLQQVADTMSAFPLWKVNYQVWVKDAQGEADESYRITLSTTIREFLKNLEREDIFDGMVMIRQKSSGNEDEILTDLIYSSIDQPRVVNYLVSEAARLGAYEADDSVRLGPLADLPYRIYDAELVFQGNRLFLVGLVSKDRFQREKLGISTVAVLIMSLIAILILLSFPVLKLALMGNYERLSLSDLLLMVMSAALGTFLVVQLLIDGYGYNGPDRKRRSQQLVELSREVSDRLSREIDTVRLQLQLLDSLVTDQPESKDITEIWQDDSLSPSLRLYPYFTSTYWTDASFQLLREWTVNPELAPKIKLDDREYLTKLTVGQGWHLPEDQLGDPSFRLQSLLARTTGEQLAVVSIESQALLRSANRSPLRAKTIFLTTKLQSLHQPVLPPGFGFAILDEQGNVWFHSNESRNLQENFLEETGDPSLRAAILNRAPLKISGSYLGQDHEFFMAPLGGMPLYLVCFRETNVYRSTHAQILSLTFFMIIAAFFMVLFFILIQVIVNPKSPLLKNDQFTFDWLRPDRFKMRSYRMLVLINSGNLLLAILLSLLYQHGLPMLCMIVLLYIYTFVLAFLKLNRNANKEFLWEENRRIVFTTGTLLIVSNIFFIIFLGFREYLGLFLFQLIPFCLLLREVGSILRPRVNVVEGKWYKGYRPTHDGVSIGRKFFYRLVGMADIPLEKLGTSIEHLLKQITPGGLFRFFHSEMSYRWFLLSWLIILGVFPVFRFYEFSYNQEYSRLLRFGQIQLLRAYEMHKHEEETWWNQYPRMAMNDSSLIDFYRNRPLPDASIYTMPFFNTQIWADHLKPSDADRLKGSPLAPRRNDDNFELVKRTLDKKTPSYEVFDSTLAILRPYYTDQARLTHRLPPFRSNGKELSWQEVDVFPKDRSLGFFKALYQDHLKLEMKQNQLLRMTSDLPYYRVPYPWKLSGSKVVFWTSFLTLIFLAYYLIKFALERFFSSDIVEQADPDPLAIRDALAILQRHIYLVIPPRVAVRDYIGLIENREELQQSINQYPRESYLFDLRKPEDLSKLTYATGLEDELPVDVTEVYPHPSEIPLLILDHVEEAVKTKEDCEKFLELVEHLLAMGPLLALVSTETPVSLQEQMVKSMIADYPTEQLDFQSDRAEAAWSKVMGEFSRIDYPIPNWHPLLYDGPSVHKESKRDFEVGNPSAHFPTLLERLEAAKTKLTPPRGIYRQFIFLAPSVLEKEAIAHLDHHHGVASVKKQGEEVKGKLLFETFHVTCTKDSKHRFHLINDDPHPTEFLIDDVSTPEQIENVILQLSNPQDQLAGKTIRIFSTLAPQELVQKLMREDHRFRDVIQTWDRTIHQLQLFALVREFQFVSPQDRVSEIIRQECMNDSFLQGLQSHLRLHLAFMDDRLNARLDKGQRAGDRRLREAVIVEIERQAHLYYQALWAACSEEEHYLIYDLAQDGLVNTHNRRGIENLIRKGIIRRGTNQLHLLNHSFRNFVLTVVKAREALAMEKKIRQEGSWNRIRVPITLILLAFGVFVFYFQADWFDDTLGLVTAIAAVIPALNSVFERIASFQLPGLPQLSSMFKKKS